MMPKIHTTKYRVAGVYLNIVLLAISLFMTFAMKMMEERKAGFKEGERQGIAKGERQGIAKGRTEGLASSIRNMMKNMGVSLEKAMDVLQIPADERTKYAALVRD